MTVSFREDPLRIERMVATEDSSTRNIPTIEVEYSGMTPRGRTKVLKIMRSYEKLGSRIYDMRYAKEQEDKYTEALAIENIGSDDIVLDMGCATGLFIKRHLTEATYVVGVDASPGLLSAARNRLRTRRHASLMISDGHYLPLKNETFDIVLMFTVIQDSPTPEVLLRQTKVSLKQSGRLLISGLKKKFRKEDFITLLTRSCLSLVRFSEHNPHDYIAVCSNIPHRGSRFL